MVEVHLFARSVQCRRSRRLIEENDVGVAEFNSSGGRLERSACRRGEGDAKMWAEPRNSCGKSGRGRRQSCRALSIAPPAERKA